MKNTIDSRYTNGIKTEVQAKAFTDKAIKGITPIIASKILEKCKEKGIVSSRKVDLWVGDIFAPIVGWYYDPQRTEYCHSKIKRHILKHAN